MKSNTLDTTSPELAKQWNSIKNDNLKPSDVTKSSSKKVWWKCADGHSWKANIFNRSNGNNYPYCYQKHNS